MKKMKKLTSILLALVMVLSLAVSVSATVSNETTGHSYKAYQVFAGTQADGKTALGDIIWGTGVNGDALLTQLKKDYNYFDSCTTAADVAKVLEGKSNDCDEAKALANAAAKNLTSTYTEIAAGAASVELATGYWLLVDVTDVGEGDARNNALLQVTNDDIEITKKYTVPSVDKTIKGEGEAADAAIGDTITFVLTATLPNNVSEYDTYKVVFHDTMSKGLSYAAITSVTIDNIAIAADKYTAATDAVTKDGEVTGETALTITFTDAKALGAINNSVIVVEYTAKVDSDAVIGSAGNPNEVYLEYSNDPNWAGDGEGPTGNTPKDEVIVFVYELDVTKVDGADETLKLKDAQFVLLNSDKTKIAKVSDGKLVEWVDISTVTVNTDGTYPADYTLTSDGNGEFAIAGLDAGTYHLRETKAPAGYNKLTSDIKIEIEATITESEEEQSLDKVTISVDDGTATDGNASTGVVETTVENNSGATLPETGGMGTKLFYVIGGLMAAAAVVLLVTKKRMHDAG